MTKKLRPFKCKSGATIMVFPISQSALSFQVKRQMSQPKPPLIKIEMGGEVTWERNHSDPDYVEAINLWDKLIQVEVAERILRRVAAKQVLNEDQKREVDELRSELEGEDLPTSDKMLWLTEIAIGDDVELRELIKTASGLADPTEEGVSQAAKNF